MAATYRASDVLANTTGTGNRTSNAFAPAVGDLWVVFCVVSANTNDTPTCSDNNSGTYDRVAILPYDTSTDRLAVFVREQLFDNTTNTTVTVDTGANNSGIVGVIAVAGMARVGTDAIRNYSTTPQIGTQSNQASGGTPAPALPASCLTENMTIGAVGAADPTGVGTATSGWTERVDTGTNADNVGLHIQTRDSGFTGTTVTWGGAAGGNFASVILELDGSTPVTTHESGALSVSAIPTITIVQSLKVIFSGALAVSAEPTLTIQSSLHEGISGPLSISAVPTIDIAQSIRDVFSGQLEVSADGVIDIAFATRLVESGAIDISAQPLINIVQSVREVVSGALGISAVGLITVDGDIDDDILRVYLTATYQDRANGDPARGKVTFKLTDEIRDAIGNIIAARVRHKAHLRDGTFTIPLPVKTGGVDYVVVEEIVGADKRQYTVTIPATPATTSLAEVS